MKTIKTAISIDTQTFLMVEKLSKKLHISRSRFFADAARYMVEKSDNIELLNKINATAVLPDDEKLSSAVKSYTKRKIVEKW